MERGVFFRMWWMTWSVVMVCKIHPSSVPEIMLSSMICAICGWMIVQMTVVIKQLWVCILSTLLEKLVTMQPLLHQSSCKLAWNVMQHSSIEQQYKTCTWDWFVDTTVCPIMVRRLSSCAEIFGVRGKDVFGVYRAPLRTTFIFHPEYPMIYSNSWY